MPGKTEPTKQDLWAQADQDEAAFVAAAQAEQDQQTAAPEDEQQPQQQATNAPAGNQPADAQEAQPAAAANDPYASLPEPVRQEIVGLKTLVESMGTRLRNAEGHIGGLNSKLQQAQTAAAAKPQPTQAQLQAAASDPQAAAELEREYPELSRLLKPVLDAQRKAIEDALAARSPAPQPAPDIGKVIDEVRKEIYVETKHPGWKETVQTPLFIGWLNSQPREVQMLAASPDPRDAVRLLDLAAPVVNRTPPPTNTSLDSAAALPTGRRSSSARVKPIEQMTKQEYWAHLDSLESQQRRS